MPRRRDKCGHIHQAKRVATELRPVVVGLALEVVMALCLPKTPF